MVPPVSGRVSRAPPYSGYCQARRSVPKGLSPAGGGLSIPLQHLSSRHAAVLQPRDRSRFGLLPVRSPLLGESLLISVPGLLRWFTSPSVTSAAYFIQLSGFQFYWRVTPFGYLRVNGYVLLTAAFRSLSRPSSPYSSQASTIDLYLLDHIIYFIFRPYACCIFQAKISSLGLFLQRYSLSVSFPYMFPSLFFSKNFLENKGLEPLTLGLQSRCSSQLS